MKSADKKGDNICLVYVHVTVFLYIAFLLAIVPHQTKLLVSVCSHSVI